MSGTFTGVGVGPGDPELMTLKAVRAVREGTVLAIPVSDSTLTEAFCTEEESGTGQEIYLKKCVAYRIAVRAVPEAARKRKLFLPMPMVKDRDRLKKIHDGDAAAAARLLDEGEDIVFLTLGDPTVYSTCTYVHRRLKEKGYATALIPGIPSFCAAAARLDMPLVENREELHVVPASYGIEESLHLAGTKVLMKAGRKMPEVKACLQEAGMEAVMVENCGMPDERIFGSVSGIPEKAGYYSLLIAKEKQRREKKGTAGEEKGGDTA